MCWQVNEGVYWHTGARGGAILDLRTSRWHWLNPSAAALWEVLTAGTDDEAARGARAALSGVPAERFNADLAGLAEQLHEAGFLSRARLGVAPQPPRRPASAADALGGPGTGIAGSMPGPCHGALVALWVAAALLRFLPIAVVVRVARTFRARSGNRRPVDPRQAAAVLEAVRRAAAWYPGRAACLETSLAAALLCWAHRRPVVWNLGVRYDPHECHAWISVGGCPVGEPGERDRVLHPVLTV